MTGGAPFGPAVLVRIDDYEDGDIPFLIFKPEHLVGGSCV